MQAPSSRLCCAALAELFEQQLACETVFSMQASELVAKGQKMYDNGDKMGALKVWEQALKKVYARHIWDYFFTYVPLH